MKKLIIFLFFLFIAGNVAANDSLLALEKNSDPKLCEYVKAKLDGSKKLLASPWQVFGSWHWKIGEINGNPSLTTKFDIDNDGTDEVLERRSWMFKSHENEAIFVYKQNSGELRNIGYIGSHPGKWDYFDLGLGYLLVSPLTFNNTHYLVIMDELFGREMGLDKSLVVAKYSNLKIHPNNKKSPNQLSVECSFMANRVFLP